MGLWPGMGGYRHAFFILNKTGACCACASADLRISAFLGVRIFLFKPLGGMKRKAEKAALGVAEA